MQRTGFWLVLALLLFAQINACSVHKTSTPNAIPVASLSALLRDLDDPQTPLHLLSDYGRQQFIASMRWSERGLGGFSTRHLIRELNPEQLQAILHYLGVEQYYAMLLPELQRGEALRFAPPSAELQTALQHYQDELARAVHKRYDDKQNGVTQFNATLVTHFERHLQRFFNDDALKKTVSENLLPLLDAALDSSEIDQDNRFVNAARKALNAIQLRGIDTRREVDAAIYTMLISAREFEQARDYLQQHPIAQVKPAPTVIDQIKPSDNALTVFDYKPKEQTLTRQLLTQTTPQLIMMVGSGCHFSQQALDTIASDAKLLKKLQALNLILITSPRGDLELNFVAQWNQAHPSLPIRIPFSRTEWTAFDQAAVPSFFIVQNGRILKQLSGWPKGGNRQALLRLVTPYKV